MTDQAKKERWEVDGHRITENRIEIIDVIRDYDEPYDAHLSRIHDICAEHNACLDIPREELEKGIVREMINELRYIREFGGGRAIKLILRRLKGGE